MPQEQRCSHPKSSARPRERIWGVTACADVVMAVSAPSLGLAGSWGGLFSAGMAQTLRHRAAFAQLARGTCLTRGKQGPGHPGGISLEGWDTAAAAHCLSGVCSSRGGFGSSGTFSAYSPLLCVAGFLPHESLRFLLAAPAVPCRSALLLLGSAAEAPANLLLQWVGCKHW